MVELLLANGVGVNQATNDGGTPLLAGSQYGHQEVVKLLLANGAQVDHADDNGATPLIMSSQNGRQEVVKLLLASGAKVNQAANDGRTPLITSCQDGHHGIVKLLLATGANVNQAGNSGATPLVVSSQKGHQEVVKLKRLLSAPPPSLFSPQTSPFLLHLSNARPSSRSTHPLSRALLQSRSPPRSRCLLRPPPFAHHGLSCAGAAGERRRHGQRSSSPGGRSERERSRQKLDQGCGREPVQQLRRHSPLHEQPEWTPRGGEAVA